MYQSGSGPARFTRPPEGAAYPRADGFRREAILPRGDVRALRLVLVGPPGVGVVGIDDPPEGSVKGGSPSPANGEKNRKRTADGDYTIRDEQTAAVSSRA